MVKDDVKILRLAGLASRLNRLFQDSAHPVDLQFRVKGRGDILQHQSQGIIEPGRGKEKPYEEQKGKFSLYQQVHAHQHRGGKADAKESLGGADKDAGGQLRLNRAVLRCLQFFIQFLQVNFLTVAGFDVPDLFQTLLHVVSHSSFGKDTFLFRKHPAAFWIRPSEEQPPATPRARPAPSASQYTTYRFR